jgi:hypothetical protein
MYALFPRYFYQWYPSFLLAPLCISIWTVCLISPLLTLRSSLCPSFGAAVIIAFVIVKAFAFVPYIFERPANHGKHAQVLRALKGESTGSNFTPASVASYTNAFSGWVKTESVYKLFQGERLNIDDYFMIFEVNRSDSFYKSPGYYVFYKAFGSNRDLVKILNTGAIPVSENSDIAVFKLVYK